MREDDNHYYYLDDKGHKKKARYVEEDDADAARDRIAASMGYVDADSPGHMPGHATLNRHRTNFEKNRIASIKRGGKARSASPLTGPSTTFTPPNTFTTTPSNFSFGAQQPQQQQQQQQQPSQGFGGSQAFSFGQQASEGNGMDRIEASSTPAPAGSSFTFGQSQQQQQPSSNGFGQQTSNPFGGFGHQNAAPNGGAQSTPSFAFGQQTQSSTANSAPSNPFGGLGQQTQPSNNNSTSFGAFGAQPQANSPAPTNPFSGFNAQPQQNGTTTPSNTFSFGPQPSNAQPSANGASTPSFGGFGASQPAQQPAQTSNLFAPQPSTEQKSQSPFQGSTSLFSKPAETPKADGWSSFKSASPAPAANGGDAAGASVFSGWQKEQTSKPAFSFSQSQMTTDDGDDDAMASPEKPAAAQSAFSGSSNLFGASQPAANAGSDLFSRVSKPAEATTANPEQATDNFATPKVSGGDLFSRMSFPEKSTEQTVSATPAPKASNPFAGFSVAPPATAPAKNLFTGASNGSGVPSTPTPAAEKAPATVKPASSFTSMFNTSTPNPPATNSMFTPKPTAEIEPEAPATIKAPSFTSSLFSSSKTNGSVASLFTPAPAASQQTNPTTANPSHTVASSQSHAAPALAATSTFNSANSSKMRKLNEGLKQRLAKADPDADHSAIFRFYLEKAKAINNVECQRGNKSGDLFTSQTPKAAPPKNLFERLPSTALKTAKHGTEDEGAANTPRKAGEPNGVDLTKSLFAPRPSVAQTPKSAVTNGMFGRVPSTEPNHGAAKRSIEDDDGAAPRTEKRRKSKETVEYPRLPAGASNTAKLFEAALDKPTDSGAAAKSLFAPKSATSEETAETPEPSTFGAFKPSTSSLFTPAKLSAAGNGNAASNSLFAPKPAAEADKPKPKAAGGFMPTFAAPPAGPSSFLASFGQNANKEQDQARKKAMDEDFDSEDDDPVEWKKQYEEKQVAKRKAIEDAAKLGGGFSMKAPTPKKPAPAEQKKQDGAASEDNTWKQGTPIKFGAEASTPVAPLTAPPKSTGMFGSSSGASLFSNMGSKTPQPSSGSSLFSQTTQTQSNGASLFSFSKTTETSSAPKPAEPAQSNTEATTNGDAAEGDEEAANEAQVEDMTALQPAEKEESDLLYYIEKAKSYKFEQKPNADKPEWVYKALGPVWLLRNKSSGKTRLLQKVAPLGKAGMNFNVLKSAAMYAQQTKKVTASFIDHLNEKEPKKPSQWFVQCGKEEDARELARLLKEEAGKQ